MFDQHSANSLSSSVIGTFRTHFIQKYLLKHTTVKKKWKDHNIPLQYAMINDEGNNDDVG